MVASVWFSVHWARGGQLIGRFARREVHAGRLGAYNGCYKAQGNRKNEITKAKGAQMAAVCKRMGKRVRNRTLQ